MEIAGENIKTEEEFYDVCRIATNVATIQALYSDFKVLNETSKKIAERDRAIGVSITGLMGNPLFDRGEVLQKGAEIVTRANKELAALLNINPSPRCTTVKPSGNATILLEGTCSGIHPPHSNVYLRRVRTTDISPEWIALKDTPLAKYENGEYIISFPICLGNEVKTKEEINAVDHIKYIGKVKHFWVNKGCDLDPNNVSATVEVAKDEWDLVSSILYVNSHLYGGCSFLPKFEGHYPNLPFTRLSTDEEKKEYIDICEYLENNHIDFKAILEEKDFDEAGDLAAIACHGGSCEIK